MRDPDWMVRTVRVVTPENVWFTYELAGLGTRIAALAIDGGIMVLVSFGVVIATAIASAAFGGWGAMMQFTLLFLVWQGYFLWFEAAGNGQTPGKRLMGIRVIDARGLRITFAQSAVRNLFRLVDALPFFYVVGGVSVLADADGRRLGDFAAGTLVVKAGRSVDPGRVVPAAERQEAEKDFELGERVRRVLRTPERDLLGAIALRRERLEERARVALFASASAYFEERLQVKKPESMSAERFVLKCCALAYLPRERQGSFTGGSAWRTA